MREGVTLVLGGARSGKSAFAERLAAESGLDRIYIATAEPRDCEMSERIRQHRERRSGAWRTVEAPDELEKVLAGEAGEGRAVLVDCLTLWLSNLLLSGEDVEARGRALCAVAQNCGGLLILVSNEVGLGLVPDTPLGRRFRDAQGRLNQAVAEIAGAVVFVAAGLPLYLKGRP
jgi:adenosylcobinamide kinase/adenosylcobinamide-phosphate guanylyltransferase